MPDATDRDLLKSLAMAQSVPTLQAAVTMVLEALDSENADLGRVSRLVSQDPAMTGQILRVSNSILYNASGMATASVHDAVSRIGGSQVRNLVVALGVVDAFAGLDIGLDFPAFWRHSFTTALAAAHVAARSPEIPLRGSERDNPYFLAGLLHDIGTLLLCQEMGDAYVDILDASRIDREPLHEVERERLGFDHQDVGAALIRRWGLPFEVAAAAEFHHRVDEAPKESSDYVLVVHAANLIDTKRGMPQDSDTPSRTEPLALGALGLDASEIPDLVERVEQAADEAELLLQITQAR